MDDGDIAERVLARLEALPHGARLLRALASPEGARQKEGRRAPRSGGPLGGVHLVGGAVRDLLRGDRPTELDLVVEPGALGDGLTSGPALADELKRRLDGAGQVHERFGTAAVALRDGTEVDVATSRTERYPRPGALPVVAPAGVDEDMARRDFTVNAIAVGISADRRGQVHHAPQAVADLDAGLLRVLHDASFLDDPTRLVRMVRYATRLGLEVEPHTRALAAEAVAAGAPATAGVARMGAELLLLLAEPDPVAALIALDELGVTDPDLRVEPEVLRRALALLPGDGSRTSLLLAALAREADPGRLKRWLAGIHLRGADAALAAARDPAGLASAMRGGSPSELHRVLHRLPPEAVALAGALGAEDEARAWLDHHRRVQLRITGDDLVAAGIPRGPEIGRRLQVALERKLDEGLATREDELAAALASTP